jgi:protease-4
MDDQPPSPEPANAPPANPPPSTVTPPPVIGTPPPLTPPPLSLPARPRSGAIWKVLTVVFLGLFLLSLLGHFAGLTRVVIPRSRSGTDRSRNLEEVVIEPTNSDQKIAVIEVEGIISSGEVDRTGVDMVQNIKDQLQMAERDSDVKAVILKVNSPGGEVLASDEINRAISRFEDQSHKPVVASMGTLAASGGYYISAPCRWIVADELTLTGSIGVIMHAYNYRQLMDKVGIHPRVFKSGQFKDMLSGEQDEKNMTAEEKQTQKQEDDMVQALIDDTYNKFKEAVKTGRERAAKENEGKGKSLVDDWQDFADGRVLSGKQAMQFGFVDELGDLDTALKRAKTLTGIARANVVQYRIPFDLGSVLLHLFGKSDAPALKVDLGMDLPKLEAGRMYFIAPLTVLH